MSFLDKFTRKQYFWLGLIVLFAGDVFYFIALFSESMTIEVLDLFSTHDFSSLSTQGVALARFFLGMLGSMLYLAGFLTIGYALPPENHKTAAYVAVDAWFITDSIVSIVFGFWPNVLLNLAFILIAFLFIRMDD